MGNEYILVTGGAGYIGSHTCKELSSSGFIPVTFDNLSTGHISNVKWGPLEIGDLREVDSVMSVFNKYEFLGVIHFAAKAYVGESVSEPLDYFENNIGATNNLIKVMKKFNVDKIVFSSSCAVYGETNEEVISENTPPNPINPYGFTKLACEKIIQYVSRSWKLKYVILRYFNASGADPDGELSEMHNPETHVIPLAITAAQLSVPFSIFGEDYDTPDGTAVRDFVHVSDLARAHVLAMKRILLDKESLICNLGSGKGTSIRQISEHIRKYFPDFKVEFSKRREGDPKKLVADPSLAGLMLDWEPSCSNFENILATLLRTHVSNSE